MRHVLPRSLAIATLLAVAGTAGAEESATALYEKGRIAYNLGKFADSLDALTRAYQLKPDAALLFNIAQCHRQLGRFADAARAYRSFLRESPDAANRAEVEKRIGDMDAAAAEAERRKPPIGVQTPAPVPRDLRSPFPATAVPVVAARPPRRADVPALLLGGGALVVAFAGIGVAVDGAFVEGRANGSPSITDRARLLGQADTERAIGLAAVGAAVVLAVAAILRAVVHSHAGGR